MKARPMKWVFIGLSITSSWGNGHATTYRALTRALTDRGHNVLFLEYDVPWYAANRDMPDPDFCTTRLYLDLEDLKKRYHQEVRSADVVIVGSYVKDGVRTATWVQETAGGVVGFYDIDTPVTLAKLRREDYEYLTPQLIPGFQLYLSFSGGKALEALEDEFGSPAARALYCSFDPSLYHPQPAQTSWDLGYLGTYSDDRQAGLETLMLDAARRWPKGRFAVAGPQYPASIRWPSNVTRINHLPPDKHKQFYNSQRFTLNITRADMKAVGHSPSVRLFESAACATPIISDWWDGLDEVFAIGREILISKSAEETLQILQTLTDKQRDEIGAAARQRVLAEHTAEHRAEQLEQYVSEVSGTSIVPSAAEYVTPR